MKYLFHGEAFGREQSHVTAMCLLCSTVHASECTRAKFLLGRYAPFPALLERGRRGRGKAPPCVMGVNGKVVCCLFFSVLSWALCDV